MKKFNKIFAATTASLLCLSSLTALSGNAVLWFGLPNSKELLDAFVEKKEPFFQIDDITLDDERIFSDSNSVFCFTDSDSVCRLRANREQLVLNFTNYLSNAEKKELEKIVQSYYPDFYVETGMSGYSGYVIYDDEALPFDGRMDTIEDAEELYNAISEKIEITSCKFYGCKISPSYGTILGFKDNGSLEAGVTETLQIYVKEKGFDVEVVESKHNIVECYLEPTRKMTAQEIMQIYTDIYKDFGLKFGSLYPSADDDIGYIEICKTDGDANTDGELDISDATLILQCLTNKDEYSLTEQGVYNADLDKDGITAADALAIQQMVAEKGELQ